MKKHLRSKRYLRSRSTVQTGRINRRDHKAVMMVKQFKRVVAKILLIDWGEVFGRLKKAVDEINAFASAVVE